MACYVCSFVGSVLRCGLLGCRSGKSMLCLPLCSLMKSRPVVGLGRASPLGSHWRSSMTSLAATKSFVLSWTRNVTHLKWLFNWNMHQTCDKQKFDFDTIPLYLVFYLLLHNTYDFYIIWPKCKLLADLWFWKQLKVRTTNACFQQNLCYGVTVKHYEKARVWISYAWTRVVVTSLNLINSAQKRIMCQSQTVILFLKIILSDVIAFQASIEIIV